MNRELQTMKNRRKEESQKPLIVGIAATAKEKKAIYAFRYRVYVEEMSRQLKPIGNDQELLYDEMDEWSFLVYVKAGSEIVGAGRVNIGSIGDFPLGLVKELSLDRFQKFYEGKKDQKFALSTKVMVAPDYRNSQVLYFIIAKGYELYCKHKVQFSFGGCNMYLLRLYEGIGLRRFGRNFIDPGYGLITPIVWLVDDVEHMRKLHSPFYRLARKREEVNKQVVDWFFTEFPEASNVINSQLVTEEELWAALSARLGNSPDKAIPILQGLSEADAIKFLHECGIVDQCHAGDRITTSGDPSNELNILLSGELHTSNLSEPGANRILPGQHFGAVGLVDHASHTQDVLSGNYDRNIGIVPNFFSEVPSPLSGYRQTGIRKFGLHNENKEGQMMQNKLDLLLVNSMAPRQRIASDAALENSLAILRTYLEDKDFRVEVIDEQRISATEAGVPKWCVKLLQRIVWLQMKTYRKSLKYIWFIFMLLGWPVQALSMYYRTQYINSKINDIIRTIRESNTHLLGIKVWYGDSFKWSKLLAAKVRQACPEVIIIAGGPQVKVYGEHVFHETDFDVAIMGPGEEILKEMIALDRKVDNKAEFLHRFHTEISQSQLVQTGIFSSDDAEPANRGQCSQTFIIPRYRPVDLQDKLLFHTLVDGLGCHME